jgi:hypothetical protein
MHQPPLNSAEHCKLSFCTLQILVREPGQGHHVTRETNMNAESGSSGES